MQTSEEVSKPENKALNEEFSKALTDEISIIIPPEQEAQLKEIHRYMRRWYVYEVNFGRIMRIKGKLCNSALILAPDKHTAIFSTQPDIEVPHKGWIARVPATSSSMVHIMNIDYFGEVKPILVVMFSPWHIKEVQKLSGIFMPTSSDVLKGLFDFYLSKIIEYKAEVKNKDATIEGLTNSLIKSVSHQQTASDADLLLWERMENKPKRRFKVRWIIYMVIAGIIGFIALAGSGLI